MTTMNIYPSNPLFVSPEGEEDPAITNFDELVAAEAHPAIRLVRHLWGPVPHDDTATFQVNVYADSQIALARTTGGGGKSGIRPRVVMWGIRGGGAPEPIPPTINECNAAGLAIGWVPNPMKDLKIAGIRCVWVEFDDGKRFEPENWDGPEPDAVVRSRGGDHLYWRVDPATTDEDALRLLRHLAVRFGGDPAVARTDHVMRLPGFLHQKDPNNPVEVPIVHLSTKDNPWKAWALRRSLGDEPTPQEWKSYQVFNTAMRAKMEVEDIGEFGSEQWANNSAAVAAYLKVKALHHTYFSRYKKPVMVPWREGSSPRWWRSLETWLRACRAYKRIAFNGGKDTLSPELLETIQSTDNPDWLTEHEPYLRAWLAAVEAVEAEADAAYAADREKGYIYPKVPVFRREDITPEMIAQAPPAPGSENVRPGHWNLHTVDWVPLMTMAGLYVGTDDDDKHTIVCPWAETHSDGNEDAAVFEPTQERPGGYHCFHSHGHKTRDLMEWLVNRLGEDQVAQHCDRYMVRVGHAVVYGRPKFPVMNSGKDGSAYPVKDRRENTIALLDHHGIEGTYDEMAREVTWRCGEDRWSDQEAIDEIRELGRRYSFRPARDILEEHLRGYLRDRSYHPVKDWIEDVAWDGEDRIEPLFATLKLRDHVDRDLALVQVRKWLVSAVAALYEAGGVKAEHVLVLVGPQACRKTTWITGLAPGFVRQGVHIDPDNKDSIRQATTTWIAELGEMRSSVSRADTERLKAFLSQTVDIYRPPYGRYDEKHPRRTVFAGSENNRDFLRDPTGNRRFWVIEVEHCDTDHGIDMQQVWAQAKDMYDKKEKWHLDPEDEAKVRIVNEGHMASDPMEDAIEAHFESDPKTWTPQNEIKVAIEGELGRWSQREGRAMTAVLGRWADRLGLKRRKSNGRHLWPIRRREPVRVQAVESDPNVDALADLLDD